MDASPSSRRRPKIDLEALRVEPFIETMKVGSFDCGNADLNAFLCTKEVAEYDREGLGRTYLVYYQGSLVAYFTVSAHSLRVEYLKTVKSFQKMSTMRLEAIPSIQIGRLAVANEWKGRGIGEGLVKYIAGMALDHGLTVAARLLVLSAEPDSVGFYERCGFQKVVAHAQKKRRKPTMFLDLHQVDEIA